jgi:hypothetical protein
MAMEKKTLAAKKPAATKSKAKQKVDTSKPAATKVEAMKKL